MESARPRTRFHRPRVRLDTGLELLLERAMREDARRVLATVVSTAGSTYRKPGARMLIMADGSYVGLLSGGCLEADLQLHADEVMTSGIARAVEYDMRGPDDILFGIGAGCEGAMRVLLEPAGRGTPAMDALGHVARATQAGAASALVVIHESKRLPLGTVGAGEAAASSGLTLPQSLVAAAGSALDDGASRVCRFDPQEPSAVAFVQYLAPPPHLLVCGAGPDARPVAEFARALGWRVSLIDHRPAYAVATRFPGASVLLGDARSLRSLVDLTGCHAAVVMSHHLPSDTAYLRELAREDGPDYVGLLGPAARRERIAEDLGASLEPLRPKLRGPVGLDLGAATPEGIALAIVGQIHAWLAGRELGG